MTRPFNLEFDNEFQYREIPGLDPSLVFPAVVVGIVGPTGAELFPRVRFGFREGISSGYFHPEP